MLFAAIISIIVGLGMIGQWAASYFSRQIPELETEPIRIGFHLAAEMSTALLLIMEGSGLLTRGSWERDWTNLGLGLR